MSNMSYCRFQNTVQDLADCEDHMDDTELSSDEVEARNKLIRLAKRIADYDEVEFEEEAD